MTGYSDQFRGIVHGVEVGDIASVLEKNNFTVVRDPVGFSAKDGIQQYELYVSPPPPDSEIQALVYVKAEAPPYLVAMFEDSEGKDTLNSLASLGSVNKVGEKYFIVSRLTIFKNDNAWNIHRALLLGAFFYSVESI